MPTVETNGVETYYESYGEGPPVVFVHGALSDHQLWAEAARPLAADYRVVVYDLRGHGLTGGSAPSTYTPELLADDLRELVAALDLAAPVVVGHSLGGALAQTYAAGDHGELAGLVLLGATAPRPQTRAEWLEVRVLSHLLEHLLDRPRLLGANHRLLSRLFDDADDDFDPTPAARVREAHPDGDPAVATAEQRKLVGLSRRFAAGAVDLSAFDVPALVLYGAHEKPAVAAHGPHLESVLPAAEVRTVPDAGHNAHVDNPAAVRDAVREHLAAVHATDAPGPTG